MLKKEKRLNLSYTENSLIFSRNQANIFSSNFFIIYLRPNQLFLKVTCIAPKAAIPLAVRRNLFRRKMYSFIEDFLLKKNNSKNEFLKFKLDVVLILKKQFTTDINQLKRDCFLLLDKTKCFIK